VNWSEVIGSDALIPLLVAAIRLAVPTMLAAVGECLCQRSGVLNLGLEGMMLTGALAAFVAHDSTGSPIAAALAGMIAGGLFAGGVALFVVRAKVDQVVTGICAVLFAQGLTGFLYLKSFEGQSTPPGIEGPPPLAIPLLEELPVLGPVLFRQTGLVYASLLLVALVAWLLFRSRFGLSVRAVGESPAAGDASGINVDRVRTLALVISGAMAGLGGAVLVEQLGFFRENVTAGRGWVAIAIVILVRWNPLGAVAGALLFGFTDALQFRIQSVAGGVGTDVPFEVFQALPYLVTLLVVVASVVLFKKRAEPGALGVPYHKEAGS
jgi:simple sugar transport system permease protein